MMNLAPCLPLLKQIFLKFRFFTTLFKEIEFDLENDYLQGCFPTSNSVCVAIKMLSTWN